MRAFCVSMPACARTASSRRRKTGKHEDARAGMRHAKPYPICLQDRSSGYGQLYDCSTIKRASKKANFGGDGAPGFRQYETLQQNAQSITLLHRVCISKARDKSIMKPAYMAHAKTVRQETSPPKCSEGLFAFSEISHPRNKARRRR